MEYNPQIHHRKSIRLKGYDYSQAGAYFITICCHNRHCVFGIIPVGAGFTPAPDNKMFTPAPNPPFTPAPDDKMFTPTQNDNGQLQGIDPTMANTMVLNDYGKIANDEWQKLPERFLNVELDVFVIMPNHMHGIIVLNETNRHKTTIGNIVGAYKSVVANECLKMYKSKWATVGANPCGCPKICGCPLSSRAGVNPALTMGKLWQRNYYEHIIRNEQSYQTICNYILNNPAKWREDKFFAG
jgi:putative transposase